MDPKQFGFTAHVQLCTRKVHGPTRATKEDAIADLNAARSGATSNCLGSTRWNHISVYVVFLCCCFAVLTPSVRVRLINPKNSNQHKTNYFFLFNYFSLLRGSGVKGVAKALEVCGGW